MNSLNGWDGLRSYVRRRDGTSSSAAIPLGGVKVTRVCGLAIRLLAAFANAAEAHNGLENDHGHSKGRGGGGGGGGGGDGDDGTGIALGVSLLPLTSWPIWLTSSNLLVNGSMIRCFDDEIMALPTHIRY